MGKGKAQLASNYHNRAEVKRMKEERRLLALKLALRDKQEQQLQTSIKNKADEVTAVRAREEDTAKELRRALQSAGLLKETARRQTSGCRDSSSG